MIKPRNASARRLRVLAITRIFPNRQEPLACPFQRQQFSALSRFVDLTVIAPLPYLPGARFLVPQTRVGKLSRLPAADVLDGLPILHPPAPYLPKAGDFFGALNGPLYLSGLLPLIPRLRHQFDLVLGAFLFPDAWAARQVARILGLPYVVKAHGTDVHVTARSEAIQPLIRTTLQGAGAVIAVSRPMLHALVHLGAAPDRVVHVANGVDRELFRPRNRREARKALGLAENTKIIVFVGRMEKEKGLEELAIAYRDLLEKSKEPISLLLLGEGSYRESLARQVKDLKNVSFLGGRPPPEVAAYLAASNLLVLPSWAEGTPNVVLEALASGRPIVATHVGGIPDVVRPDRTGLLVAPKDPSALAITLHKALHRSWSEEEIAATAPPDWGESGEMLHEVLKNAWIHDQPHSAVA